MAKKKRRYKLDGLKAVFDGINALDKKTKGQVINSVLRKVANKVKKPLAANAPNTPHGTFKNTRNIKVSIDRELSQAVVVGYTSVAFTARFLEKGTRMRKGPRGRITPKPWIGRTHHQQAPSITKDLTDNLSDIMIKVLKSKSKSLIKRRLKLSK